MSQAYFESLAPDLQSAIREVAVEVGRHHRQSLAEQDERHLDFLQGKLQIDDIDRAAFEEVGTPIYEHYIERFGPELVEMARSYRTAAP